MKVVRYSDGTLHQVAMPLLSQIDNAAVTALPDGTSFFAGTHNLGRHRTAGLRAPLPTVTGRAPAG